MILGQQSITINYIESLKKIYNFVANKIHYKIINESLLRRVLLHRSNIDQIIILVVNS